MTSSQYPPEFLERVRAVTAKRAKTVIDFILQHGSITTEQLKELGYDHPPRAARDVREQGIPLVTSRVVGSNGRKIGAYTFGDPNQLVAGLTGRTAISKRFKKAMVEEQGLACAVCGQSFEERYLQTDHRIPVEIGGDQPDETRVVDDYMLLDGGCNRAKSWSCEQCPNVVTKDVDVCGSCYWANPDRPYTHVATVQERRADLVWQGEEIAFYADIEAEAAARSLTVSEVIKDRLLAGWRSPDAR